MGKRGERQHLWSAPVHGGFPHGGFKSKKGIACLRLRCGLRQRAKPGTHSMTQISRDGGATWEDLYWPPTQTMRPMPPCGGDA